MKKTKKELIAEQFDNITDAAKKLGVTRRTVYKFIEADKLTTRIKNIIIAAGYDPETFKPVTH